MGFGSHSSNSTPQPATTPVTPPSDASVTRTTIPTAINRANSNDSAQLLGSSSAPTVNGSYDDPMLKKQTASPSLLS